MPAECVPLFTTGCLDYGLAGFGHHASKTGAQYSSETSTAVYSIAQYKAIELQSACQFLNMGCAARGCFLLLDDPSFVSAKDTYPDIDVTYFVRFVQAIACTQKQYN